MTVDPFPMVRSDVELGAVPAREWVECAGCMEHEPLGNGSEASVWAELHAKERGHDRFRTVRQANFRVIPGGARSD